MTNFSDKIDTQWDAGGYMKIDVIPVLDDVLIHLKD